MAEELDIRPVFFHPGPEAPDWRKCPSDVGKIIVGKLDGDAKGMAGEPPDFAQGYPHLTHLHLWHLDDLSGPLDLRRLGLRVLDLRGCGKITAAVGLPPTLETLDLGDCAGLTELGLGDDSFSDLIELFLNGCRALAQGTIRDLIGRAPGLRTLDLGGCDHVDTLYYLPPSLQRLQLKGCSRLTGFAGDWSPSLHHIDLQGCDKLEAIPALSEQIAILNIAQCRSLAELPLPLPAALRELYLFGSGISEIQEADKGEDARDNVAKKTMRNLSDRDEFGEAQVHRAKLMLLGNGAAGKTSLAKCLHPDLGPDPCEKSTHGIHFWLWAQQNRVGRAMRDVTVNVWDFGGQDIYRNTHRLFLTAGSIFLIVHNPEEQPPEPDPHGFEDIHWPLQYWLDYVHGVDRDARLAIVCTRCPGGAPDGEPGWVEQLAPAYRDRVRTGDLPVYYVDALHSCGDLNGVQDWISRELIRLFETYGMRLNRYTKIAISMVEEWLREDSGKEDLATFNHTTYTMEEILDRFNAAIDEDQNDGAALRDRNFTLTPERLEDTLEHLTNSGWVYWSRRLFERRVIVGQQWAIDGIYAILARDADPQHGQTIRLKLVEAKGRFTRSDLAQWAWGKPPYSYTNDEQQLLLSFMEQIGLCFKLVPDYRSYWGHNLYISIRHLPSLDAEDFERDFKRRIRRASVEDATGPSPDASVGTTARVEEPQELKFPYLHTGHWESFLSYAGERFGRNGLYALNGLVVQTEAEDILLVRWREDDASLHYGGKITIKAWGREAKTLLDGVATWFKRRVPDVAAVRPFKETEVPAQTCDPTRWPGIKVFVSYAWNTKDDDSYEKPVDAIEKAIAPLISWERDKRYCPHADFQTQLENIGYDIEDFIRDMARGDLILVVHSDRYWRSDYCMYEVHSILSILDRTKRSFLDNMLCIEHPTSKTNDSKETEAIVEHWNINEECSQAVPLTVEELNIHARSRATTLRKDLARMPNWNRRWAGRENEAVSFVIARIRKLLKEHDSSPNGG